MSKTYISGRDYKIYRQWWIDNYDKMIRELGDDIWLYTFGIFPSGVDVTPKYLSDNKEDIKYFNNAVQVTLWNTTPAQELWLAKNCNIQSFRDHLYEEYDHKWKGFKGQKWVAKCKTKQKYKR